MPNFSGMTLDEFVAHSLRNLADRIYRKSQQRVPVRTGQLKASGSVKHRNKESKITYNVPYAKMVDEGISGQLDPDRTMAVKEHTRTYPSGRRVRVRTHEKKVGRRPQIPNWKGTRFLSDAIDEEVEMYLKDLVPTGVLTIKSL